VLEELSALLAAVIIEELAEASDGLSTQGGLVKVQPSEATERSDN